MVKQTGLERMCFFICDLSTFKKSPHCSCMLPSATLYVLRSDLMASQSALSNIYHLVLVCFGMFALAFRSTNMMSWSTVGVSGGVVATQLTREGFEVKNRSSMFDFLVGCSMIWLRELSFALSISMFESLALLFPGRVVESAQSIWGRL